MTTIQDDPRVHEHYERVPSTPPPTPPMREHRLRPAWVAVAALAVFVAVLALGGTRLPMVASQEDPQAAIEQVIQRANSEQAQALANNDPSAMSDTATAAYYRQLAQVNQQMAAQGVTSIQLTNLTWGPVTINGTTATATTYETWVTTFSDGTTSESTDTNVYTLVEQNGRWLIESDQQPTTPPAGGQPPASATPQPQSPPLPAVTTSATTSHNWSGYVAAHGSFTGVTGTWTVPQPSSSTTTAGVGATWVGIGGVTSQDLIQAGTQDVTVGGQHQFQSWIEMLPAASQQVPLAVAPGDSITVSINESAPGSGVWSIVMKNNTTGQSYQTTVQYRSSQSSAEWIEEAPANVSGNATTITPLDNFGTVSFSGATAIENGQTVDMAQSGAQGVTMVNSANQALAVPSAIGSDGSSFSVTRTSAPASTTPVGRVRGQRGGGTPPAIGR
jgi:hypothetical protein